MPFEDCEDMRTQNNGLSFVDRTDAHRVGIRTSIEAKIDLQGNLHSHLFNLITHKDIGVNRLPLCVTYFGAVPALTDNFHELVIWRS